MQFDAEGVKIIAQALHDMGDGLGLNNCTPSPEQGRKSYVLFLPNDHVLKVQRPHQKENWLAREIVNMQKFDVLGITTVDYPKLDTFAADSSWLSMSRMGSIFPQHWRETGQASLPPADVKALGEQVGDFVAELYKKGKGAIHKDLHFANMTYQPGGRLGIIDFDDYGPGDPHEAFIKLMRQQPNIVPAAATAFTRQTGIAIDPQKVADLCIADLQRNNAPEEVYKTVQENLAEWKKQNQPAHNQRPQPGFKNSL